MIYPPEPHYEQIPKGPPIINNMMNPDPFRDYQYLQIPNPVPVDRAQPSIDNLINPEKFIEEMNEEWNKMNIKHQVKSLKEFM